jgi:tetratricopeptide (TPR) repeat protein
MKHLDYIDDYFKGARSASKTLEFEQRLEEDPLFAEEVAFYLSAMQVLREEARTEKTERFRAIYEEHRTPVRTMRPWAKIISYATAAAVLAGVLLTVYLFFLSPASKQQMADNYIQQNFATLDVKMGGLDSLEMAKDLYNRGRYTEALAVLDVLVRHDDAKKAAFEYAGITSLRLKQYDKALQLFGQMALRKGYDNAAVFYQALTLMKRNKGEDLATAKTLLQKIVDEDLPQKEVAEKWLEKW